MNQTSFFCPQCHQMRLFQQKEMNHTPHILASVFLCGLWLPIWILTALTFSPSWHCAFCGFSDAPQYLANPNLREQHRLTAQQQARIRLQTDIDRDGSTFQERVAYFLSDNKRILMVVGVIAGTFGLIIFATTLLQQPKQSSSLPTNPASTAIQQDEVAINARRTFAQLSQLKYEKTYPGLVITSSGNKDKALFITAKGIDDKFAKEFESGSDSNRGKLKEIGFTSVRISNGKKEWIITP